MNAMRNLRSVFQGYNTFLKTYPVFTQAVQTGVICGIGDVLAQTILEEKRILDVDLRRLANMTAIGTVLIGPSIRIWYGFLDKTVKGKTKYFISLKKMAFDQLIFAPVFLGIFMTSIGILSGQRKEEIQALFKQEYFNILVTNYKVWPAVQILNFSIIPLNYQVLFVQVVAVFWNTFISWRTHQTHKV